MLTDPEFPNPLNTARALDLLTADQELTYILAAQAGDKTAMQELVYRNQRLVLKIAASLQRMGVGSGAHELDDLCQWGTLGLMHAIRKFNPEKKCRLSTNAVNWIVRYIRRFATKEANPFYVPYHVQDRLEKYKGLKAKGHCPTAAAEQANLNQEEIIFADKYSEVKYIEDLFHRPMNGTEDAPVEESLLTINAPAPAEELALANLESEALHHALGELDPTLQTILEARYFTSPPVSYPQLAARFHRSHTTIQNMEKLALNRLKATLTNQQPKLL